MKFKSHFLMILMVNETEIEINIFTVDTFQFSTATKKRRQNICVNNSKLALLSLFSFNLNND